MATSRAVTKRTCLRIEGGPGYGLEHSWWMQHREATLNWLALGMLLAAWNATEEDTLQFPQRPETLRGHAYVSVRAATLNCERRRTAAPD
jgi:hypothetical protein